MDVSCEIAVGQQRRTRLVLTVIGLAFAGLFGRLIYINTAMAPRLHSLAAAQRESTITIPARRGMIFDSRGRVMAGDDLRPSVFADPQMIVDPEQTARSLAPVLHLEAGEIENEIRICRTRFCWLKRLVDESEAQAIRQLKLPGIGLIDEFERRWPMHEVAAQMIGFTGSDGHGLEGIELRYDEHLRGVDGRRHVLRNQKRAIIAGSDEPLVPPQDGGHVVLTIDSVIQEYVEDRLGEQVQAFKAESGVAVVMSPKSGEVLAMACYPVFDLNRHEDCPAKVRRNRILTDPVEPGSIFKPFVMAGALDGEHVRPGEFIDCHNGFYVFPSGHRMHDTKPHGVMSIRDVLVQSSNIGMGQIGCRMGNRALHDIITRFGFGRPTGIELPGESGGLVGTWKSWTAHAIPSISIGQQLAVTPLQLATAYCAIVNQGVRVLPYVVQARLGPDGRVFESRSPAELSQRVIAADTATWLQREPLSGVVERGGKELDVTPYTMCGKTGTAQIPYQGRRGYEPDANLSSFLGAAPADDPQVVVLVMIRKPDRRIGHFGRVVSGPVVRDVVKTALEYMGVPPAVELASHSSTP